MLTVADEAAAAAAASAVSLVAIVAAEAGVPTSSAVSVVASSAVVVTSVAGEVESAVDEPAADAASTSTSTGVGGIEASASTSTGVGGIVCSNGSPTIDTPSPPFSCSGGVCSSLSPKPFPPVHSSNTIPELSKKIPLQFASHGSTTQLTEPGQAIRVSHPVTLHSVAGTLPGQSKPVHFRSHIFTAVSQNKYPTHLVSLIP
mmetsp:Transcript_19085/g.21033  ORF Transcript_19085/g.21033 Transcript_19085/m.21033 type:complete len:202 (+) Transcript_19085:186-791(+)